MFFSSRLFFILNKFKKHILILLIILMAVFAYVYISNHIKESNSVKEKVAIQKDKIENLQTQIVKKEESSIVSIDAVTNKQKEEVIYKDKVVIKTIYVKEKIKAVDKSDSTEEEKNMQKSTIYIENLHSTYCFTNPNNCEN